MNFLIILAVLSIPLICFASSNSDNRNISSVMAQAKKMPDVNRGKRTTIAPYPRTPIKTYPKRSGENPLHNYGKKSLSTNP